MNLLLIAWKSVRQRALASFLTGLSVALAVALMVTVLVIHGVVSRMFNQTATGYDLVVGAKGSPLQLVLNTIFFMDRPIENLPYTYYLRLKNNRAVETAIPFNLGDSTADARFRIIGTVPEFFEIEYIPKRHFSFREGRGFSDAFEAVIGSRVAQTYGWTVGHEFPIAHGGNVDDIHAERFKVVGILAPTGTPNDRGVFVHLDGFYQMPGHEKPLSELQPETALPGEKGRRDLAHLIRTEPDAPHTTPGLISDDQKEVTAILVRSRSLGMQQALERAINSGRDAQATNPVGQIYKLMTNLVGNIYTALVALTTMILLVSGIGIFVSIYNSMSDRRREIAIMRALGASRSTVFSTVITEAVLLCLLGGLGGLILGHALVLVAAPVVEARSDILIEPWTVERAEWVLLPGVVLLGAVVGLLPAWSAYRTDVASNLNS